MDCSWTVTLSRKTRDTAKRPPRLSCCSGTHQALKPSGCWPASLRTRSSSTHHSAMARFNSPLLQPSFSVPIEKFMAPCSCVMSAHHMIVPRFDVITPLQAPSAPSVNHLPAVLPTSLVEAQQIFLRTWLDVEQSGSHVDLQPIQLVRVGGLKRPSAPSEGRNGTNASIEKISLRLR